MRVGFHYRAKFIRHGQNTRGPVTSFQIGTQDKTTKVWTNYKIVVWGDLPIQENEEIEISSIQGVDLVDYKDKEDVIHKECQIIALVKREDRTEDV
jgi:hypothetical protein